MPKTSKPSKTQAADKRDSSQGQPSALTEQLGGYWPDFQAAAPKAVHEVRKLTRRAAAEAGVSDLKKKVRREWRDLRRAAAPLRDHDAAGEHLQAALKEMGASRAEQQRFQHSWAERRAALLEAHPLPAQMPGGYALPADWPARAEQALSTDRKALLKQGKALMKRDDSADSEAWHDWRKLMKRYRYTLELSGKAPREVRAMLEHLGRLQDAEVLLDLLGSEGAAHFNQAHLDALTAREQQARLDARTAARALWPELKAHLKGEKQAAPAEEPEQPEPPAAKRAPAKVVGRATAAAGNPENPARPKAAKKAGTGKAAPKRSGATAQAKAPAQTAAASKAAGTKAAPKKPAASKPASQAAAPRAAAEKAAGKAANTSQPQKPASQATRRKKPGAAGSDS